MKSHILLLILLKSHSVQEKLIVFLASTLFFTSASFVCSEPLEKLNTLTEAEQQMGWKLLFDGKTTNGWRRYKKQDVGPGWKVIDGALTRIAEGAGDLVTLDTFDSFELLIDYNISPNGNSGIMFHVTEQEEAPWMSGPEIQIVDNKGYDPQLSGWLYDLYPCKIDATKPLGQWNTLRLVVTPQKCETYLNGIKYYEYVIDSTDWDCRVARSKFARMSGFGKAANGHIALQDHNSWVAFRNIKIRPIPLDEKGVNCRAER